MSAKITTVAFYDTLGENAAMFMVNQTRVSTMALSGDCIDKICKLKLSEPNSRMASLKNLISFDEVTSE